LSTLNLKIPISFRNYDSGSGLGRVEAVFCPGAGPHLGHFFLEILLGLGWAWNLSARALGHIWVIFQSGRWVTLERFSKTFSF
jgi:hypothetical protein